MTPQDRIRQALAGMNIQGIEPHALYADEWCLTFDHPLDSDMLGEIQKVYTLSDVSDTAVIIRLPNLDETPDESDVQPETTSDSTVPTKTTVDPAIGRITDELTRLGNNVVGARISVYHRGSECPTGDCYAVIFDKADDIVTFEGHNFTSLFRNGNRFVVVGIPAAWKQAEEIAPAEPTDDELKETATLIKRLQRRVAELAEDKQRLEQRVETLVDERDELIEQCDSAIAMASVASDLEAERTERALEGRLLTNPCKEVMTKRSITDSEFQKMLNDGWNIQHVQFQDVALHVVFIRQQSAAPAPNTLGARAGAWRMIEPVPGTHTVYPPVPQFNIPAYDMPLGLTQDERVEYRVNQIKAAAQDYIRARVTGEQS